MSRELKPCPFCGGEPFFGTVRYSAAHIKEQHWDQDTFHFAGCVQCGAQAKGLIGHKDQEKAAQVWNRREADPSAEIAALREALRSLIPYAESHEDEGPSGEGWQSHDLEEKVQIAKKLIEKATP